ncbi:hypothetical protein COCMIDRAFT_28430 [Bipolaris oryzae ATCC 44560]|uniref:Uncharacterized protein n=1 Tax=Bipolaris oryzae ATCC 44560 TaxID=930090 RepID=W6YUB6_COCMI|nr:uncharacterized protein COCMIDRAFT_28430 [Bipolaris oryzae ATCC 44560]EUC43057.1 hypothetical protein COCMIDRAFT_28430 [Bipolaris oryzae ATCC 44560]
MAAMAPNALCLLTPPLASLPLSPLPSALLSSPPTPTLFCPPCPLCPLLHALRDCAASATLVICPGPAPAQQMTAINPSPPPHARHTTLTTFASATPRAISQHNLFFSQYSNPPPISRCCELFRHVPASVSCLASPLAERLTPCFSQSVTPGRLIWTLAQASPPNPGFRPQRRRPLSVPQTRAQIFFSRCQWLAQTIPERPPSTMAAPPPSLPPRASEIRTLGPRNRAPTSPGNQQPSTKPFQLPSRPPCPPHAPSGRITTLPSTASHLHACIQHEHEHEHEQPACTPPIQTIIHTRSETAPTLLLFA